MYEKIEKFVGENGGNLITLGNGVYIIKFPEMDSYLENEKIVTTTTTKVKVVAALKEAGFDFDLSKHWDDLVNGISNPYDKVVAKHLAEVFSEGVFGDFEGDYIEIMRDCRKLRVSPFHLMLTTYSIPCRGAKHLIKIAETYFESYGADDSYEEESED